MRSIVFSAATVASLVLAACSSPHDHPPSGHPGPSGNGTPMVVTLDAGQTMNAEGGKGVGVFVEYQTGGHWHVWMTCDSNLSRQDCPFSVSLTPSVGTIQNAATSSDSQAAITFTPNAASVWAQSRITTQVAGFDFDTTPGALVTVGADVGGLQTGDFFFFVQDGKINGGYTGKLTNPLTFQPSAP